MTTTTDTWHKAIAAVDEGMTYREAKDRYKLGSVCALRMRRLGEIPLDASRGPKPRYLTDSAEAGIVEAITFRAKRGMCFDMPQLRHLIASVAKVLHADAPNVVPPSFPNVRFAQRFLKRHPEVSMRKGQVFDNKRFDASTIEAVEMFYKELAGCMERRNYSPNLIFNADETGITPQGRRPLASSAPRGLEPTMCAATIGKTFRSWGAARPAV